MKPLSKLEMLPLAAVAAIFLVIGYDVLTAPDQPVFPASAGRLALAAPPETDLTRH